MLIGQSGTGTLNVTNEGNVTAGINVALGNGTGGIGTATVSGTNSVLRSTTNTDIGFLGTGTVNVESGGKLAAGNVLVLGGQTTGVGNLNVDGSGSEATSTNATFIGNNGSGTATVTDGGRLRAGGSITIAEVAGSDGSLNVSGSSSVAETDVDLYVGRRAAGSLNVSSGGSMQVDRNAFVGGFAGSSGIATISGIGSQLQVANTLDVGFADDSATLNVNNGATTTAGKWVIVGDQATADGVVNVDGTGSSISSTDSTFIGNNGKGTVNVTNGGVAGSEINYTLGDKAGSTGTANISGSGSNLIAGLDGSGEMRVGANGSGTLIVTNGGTAESANAFNIGRFVNGSGQVTVDGAGSTAKSGNGFLVGGTGAGTLTVQNGGLAESERGFFVGNQASATGTATVTGTGSRINAGTESGDWNLVVGALGDGTLNVNNGGRVDVDNHLNLGQSSGAVGRLNIDGANSIVDVSASAHIGGTAASGKGGTGIVTVTNGGVLQIEDKLTIFQGSSLTVDSNSILSAGSIVADGDFNWASGNLSIDNGGVLSGTGDFSGVGMITVANGGIISPGNSTGTLTAGDLTWGPGGSYLLEVNDFTGLAGSTSLGWDLLDATSIDITATSGNPFTINLASLDGSQNANPALNFDDTMPYSLMFGTTSGGITGFNPSVFTVNTGSFQNAFGGSWFVSQAGNDLFLNYSTAAAVPEPSTFALLGLCGVVAIWYRRKRTKDVA